MNWLATEPKRSHYDTGGESLFQGFLPELFAVSLDTCLKNEKKKEGTGEENENKHLSKLIFDLKYTFHLKGLPKAGSQSLWVSKNLSFRNMTFSISFLTPLFLPNNLHQNIIQLTWQLRGEIMKIYAS